MQSALVICGIPDGFECFMLNKRVTAFFFFFNRFLAQSLGIGFAFNSMAYSFNVSKIAGYVESVCRYARYPKISSRPIK